MWSKEKLEEYIFNKIEENIQEFNNSNNTRYNWDKRQAITRLNRWIPRIVEKLKDKKNLFRLLVGVNETIVPDFWAGDEIALSEFEESFCSHIVLELSKSHVKNWVAQWLRDEFEFGGSLNLEINWDRYWDNDDEWLNWLRNQAADPFEKLPDNWLKD